jgi:uncharacterized protein YcbK (DUF882 family)
MRLTKNFSSEEFECPCCQACAMNTDFLAKLQELRSFVARPMNINSGFRCENHNRVIGGFDKSRHLSGDAIDCCTVGWSSSDLYSLISKAQELGFKGIGIGKTYVHLDTRSGKAKMWVY